MDKNIDIKLSTDMPIKSWLEYWFDVYAKRTVKQSTAVFYHGYINRSYHTAYRSVQALRA